MIFFLGICVGGGRLQLDGSVCSMTTRFGMWDDGFVGAGGGNTKSGGGEGGGGVGGATSIDVTAFCSSSS